MPKYTYTLIHFNAVAPPPLQVGAVKGELRKLCQLSPHLKFHLHHVINGLKPPTNCINN